MNYSDSAPAWVEKYRPRTIEDCVLPQSLKSVFQNVVDSGTMNAHFLCHGRAGIGKTTVARAMCNELGIEPLFVNSSENGNIDTLRTKIRDYCSTRSFDGSRKCVILDEADHLTAATQAALRGFTEEFASNVSFILTANTASKIIEPLHSRSAVIEFKIPKAEVAGLAKQMLKRLKWILTQESVEFEDRVLAEVLKRYFPDFRRTLNELQRYANQGPINSGILSQVQDVSIEELVTALKEDDFRGVRKWCALNAEGDSPRVIRRLYDSLYEFIAPASIPEVVIVLGEYLHRASFSQDQEINLAACLTQIMVSATMLGK